MYTYGRPSGVYYNNPPVTRTYTGGPSTPSYSTYYTPAPAGPVTYTTGPGPVAMNLMPTGPVPQLRTPELSVVTYYQAQLPDERESAVSGDKQGEGEVSKPSAEEEHLLALTPAVLEKILRLPPTIQEATLRVIEQQNALKMLELQKATGSGPAPTGPGPLAVPPGPVTVERLGPEATPEKIPAERLMGVNANAPTLEEIKEINRKNLELAANAHVAGTVPARLGNGPAVQFSDEEKVKETLLALNPQWQGHADALMAAMKAKLAGQSVEFTVAGPTGAVPVESGTVPARTDPGWEKVCHNVTHTLQIGMEDGQSRSVPIVQIYEDPPVFVFSDLLTKDECDALIAVSHRHWDKVDKELSGPQPADLDPQTRDLQKVIARMARLPRGKSRFLDRILTRVATALQVDESALEDLTVMRYREGEGSEEHIEAPTRKTTMLIYLNSVEAGGQTDFVKLGFQIQPEAGTAAVWHNLIIASDCSTSICPANVGPDGGLPEDRMLHASLPPLKGCKYVLAVYVKNPDFKPPQMPEPSNDADTQ